MPREHRTAMTPDQLYRLGSGRPAEKEAHTHAGALAVARAALRRYPVALAAFLRAVEDAGDPAGREEMLRADLEREGSTVSPGRLGEALAFLSWEREGAALTTYGTDETPRRCSAPGCGATVARGDETCGRCDRAWTPAEVLPVRSDPTVIDRLARLGGAFRAGMTRAEVEARAAELPLVAAHAAAVADAYKAAAQWYEAIGGYLDIVEHPDRATVEDERRVTRVINGIPGIVERGRMLRNVRTAAVILSYAPSEVIALCASRVNCGRPVPRGAGLCEVHQGEQRRRRLSRSSRLHRRHRRPHRLARPTPVAISSAAPTCSRWSVVFPYFVAAAAILFVVFLARPPAYVADEPITPPPLDSLADKKPAPPPKDKRPPPSPKDRSKGRPVENPTWDRVTPGRAPDLFLSGECQDAIIHSDAYSWKCRPVPDAPVEEVEEWERRFGP